MGFLLVCFIVFFITSFAGLEEGFIALEFRGLHK